MLRFTTSPTRDLEINDLYCAILNYLISQQRNEPFLIRIEDLESAKNIEGKDSEIMQILEKFALKHNDQFHQSEHLNLYQTLALPLLKEKKAFICKCLLDSRCNNNCQEFSSKEIETIKSEKEKFIIRLTEDSSVIIMKEDGKPSYTFATATDDMMSGITLIIEPEKAFKNSPKQLHIQKLLGYDKEITHSPLPSIQETPSLQWLFEEGFVPDAILNYLLLLGNPNAPIEIFTLPQAIEWFKPKSIPTTESLFELKKLRAINREHLKRMKDKELSTLFNFADADIGKLAKVYLEEECSTLKELEAKINPIFKAKDFSGKWGEEMQLLSEIIFQAPPFETFDAFWQHLTTQSKLEDDRLLPALTQLLTGTENGSRLSDIYPFIKSYILEVAS